MSFFSKLFGKKQEETTSKKKTYPVLSENTPFNVTEAFRNIKAALSVSVPKKEGGRIIMVSSAYPSEGKTTVAVNLALMFALSNAKVLLIDADLRKGTMARYFACNQNALGLSDCLSGQAPLDEVAHVAKNNENLSFIPRGTRSPKPYELLESKEMQSLLDELSTRFDYIIIDTPPLLVISDALPLVGKVDGTVLVCRHLVSRKNDLSKALSTLRFAKANILGVIVNDYKAPLEAGDSGNKNYYYYSYADVEETPSAPVKE